jgi:transposase
LRSFGERQQKFDREDARLLLRLMRENNFPQIWVPGPENRDLRQLLWHRHRMVQMRTRIMNQLRALAMNEGYRWKKKQFFWETRSTKPRAQDRAIQYPIASGDTFLAEVICSSGDDCFCWRRISQLPQPR